MAEEISKDKALKILVKSSGISFFGMALSQIILYLLRLVLARALTPSEYGLLFLGFSIINILMAFETFCLEGGIVRYVPYYAAKKDFGKVKGAIVSSIKISFPVSLFLFVVIFFFSDQISLLVFHEPSLSGVLKIFSFALPFFVVYKIFSAALLGFKGVKYDVISWQIGRSLAILLSLLLFLALGFGLAGATMSYVLGFVVSGLLALVFLEKKVFRVLKGGLKPVSMQRQLLSFSLPLLIFSLLWNFMERMDTIMIGALKTTSDVGMYQTALPTSQFLYVIPGALGTLFLPVVSEMLSKKKTEDIGAVYKTVAKWAFYINLPVCLVLVMYPNAVINMLFGSEYIEAGNALRLLSLAALIYSMSMLSATIINLFEKTKYHILNAGAATLVGVLLNYLLIPVYGIVGSAIAMLVTFALYTSLLITETYLISGYLPFHRGMLKAAVSGVISIAAVYYLTKFLFATTNIWILTPMFLIFIAVYALLLLVLKGLGEEDIMILKAIEAKTGMRIKFIRKFIKKFI